MSDARAWLDDPMNVILDPQSARSALLAVLDLHQRYDTDHGSWCFGCDGGVRVVEWPCSTVQVINMALGISDE